MISGKLMPIWSYAAAAFLISPALDFVQRLPQVAA